MFLILILFLPPPHTLTHTLPLWQTLRSWQLKKKLDIPATIYLQETLFKGYGMGLYPLDQPNIEVTTMFLQKSKELLRITRPVVVSW
jgi:hypothetical protein